jgi:hypothetical protein
MKANVGPRERMARIGMGALMLALAFRRRSWALAAMGVVNLATAATRYCPGNSLLGIDNTRGKEWVHFASRRLNKMQRRAGLYS